MQERSGRLLRAHREQSPGAPPSSTDQQSVELGREVTHTPPWVSTLHPAPSNHLGANSSSSAKALFFLSFFAGGTGDYCGNFPIVSQYLHVKPSDGILSQRPTTQTFTGTRWVITVTLSRVATEKKKTTTKILRSQTTTLAALQLGLPRVQFACAPPASFFPEQEPQEGRSLAALPRPPLLAQCLYQAQSSCGQ